MARVSFTLRKNAPDHGSYVRYDSVLYDAAASAGNAASAGTWTYDIDRDTDTYLRADGYQLPPSEFVDSFLEAYAVAYGTTSITWGVPLATTITSEPQATQTVLVYSTYGPASTISSGTVLSESSNEFSYTHIDLLGGQWSYYTLFVRYQSNAGDDYYEPVASVEVLMPENYGSTLDLWRRIPEYYRQQDISIGEYVNPSSDYAVKELGSLPPGNIVGPLFKFLSIFGFEMDRTRTILDYTMVSRDPSIANTEVLNALSATLGVGLGTSIINASRIRAVLDDIGYIRRSKGTLEGIVAYARALSNCEVEFDQGTRSLKFYSQRVNYMTDPKDATGLLTARPAHEAEAQRLRFDMGTYDPTTYDPDDEDTYPDAGDQPYAPGMYWTSASASTFEGIPVGVGDYIVAYPDVDGNIVFGVSGYDFNATNYSAYNTYTLTTPPYVPSGGSDSTYIPNGSGASVGVSHLLVHLDSPVPVLRGDSVFFSVHSAIGTSGLKWARLVDQSGNVLGTSTSLTRASDSPAAEVVASSDTLSTTSYTIAFVELLVDLESVASTGYVLRDILIERNRLGNYFDGSTRRGGWLIDAGSISDYRWVGGPGNAYNAISLYTEEYQRTRALIKNIFSQALPVTVASYYTISETDAVPGWDAITAYLTP